ncbi:MAG: adaptor protein MecA [Bacillales bacterium]|jgi:adapter protein MecA 1/2|nr:adaptor protein MecA [Bacillales bacterium]
MDIERINEDTVKFFISYIDIESKGFTKDDIWYDRERSEQLFWEMMEELDERMDDRERLELDGPLWIQVQMLDLGLEVMITKAQISSDGDNFEIVVNDEKRINLPIDDKLEALLETQNIIIKKEEDNVTITSIIDEEFMPILVKFKDIEDIISLSKRLKLDNIENQLYFYESLYYLTIEFRVEDNNDEEIDEIMSIVLEFGEESELTIHRIKEYGKLIINNDALEEIYRNFKN